MTESILSTSCNCQPIDVLCKVIISKNFIGSWFVTKVYGDLSVVCLFLSVFNNFFRFLWKSWNNMIDKQFYWSRYSTIVKNKGIIYYHIFVSTSSSISRIDRNYNIVFMIEKFKRQMLKCLFLIIIILMLRWNFTGGKILRVN